MLRLYGPVMDTRSANHRIAAGPSGSKQNLPVDGTVETQNLASLRLPGAV